MLQRTTVSTNLTVLGHCSDTSKLQTEYNSSHGKPPGGACVKKRLVYQCQCPDCQRPEPNPIKEWHSQMNFFLSTLDERQRRLYVGLESRRLGYGGDRHLAMITGLNAHTIAKGRLELEQAESSERVRAPGGGRLRVEKKTL
jgi:hypothetical protein